MKTKIIFLHQSIVWEIIDHMYVNYIAEVVKRHYNKENIDVLMNFNVNPGII